MPYATATDVAAVLAKAGIVVDPQDLAPYLKAAVAWWERETGWKPFLGTASAQEYDPPGAKATPPYNWGGGGHVLRLRNGLLAVASLAVRGGTLVEGKDFWLVKEDDGWPAEAVRFAIPVVGPPQSVVIDGTWGFLPDEDTEDLAAVNRAIAQMAAGDYAGDKAESAYLAGGVTQIKRGSDSVSLDPRLLASSGSGWKASAARAAASYVRTTAGI